MRLVELFEDLEPDIQAELKSLAARCDELGITNRLEEMGIFAEQEEIRQLLANLNPSCQPAFKFIERVRVGSTVEELDWLYSLLKARILEGREMEKASNVHLRHVDDMISLALRALELKLESAPQGRDAIKDFIRALADAGVEGADSQ